MRVLSRNQVSKKTADRPSCDVPTGRHTYPSIGKPWDAPQQPAKKALGQRRFVPKLVLDHRIRLDREAGFGVDLDDVVLRRVVSDGIERMCCNFGQRRAW